MIQGLELYYTGGSPDVVYLLKYAFQVIWCLYVGDGGCPPQNSWETADRQLKDSWETAKRQLRDSWEIAERQLGDSW